MLTHDSIERIRDGVLRAIGRPGPAISRAVPPSPWGSASDLLPADIAPLIDHTLLKPDATLHAIAALCREAIEYTFAAVCVNPYWVSTCEQLLRGSGVAVCAVAAFPLGASVEAVKVAEAERAIADGAGEIDMVMNVGALKSQQLSVVADDVDAVVAVCRRHRVLCKVILEMALLTESEKITACVIAQACGADYVKTSTGAAGGATVDDVVLMRGVVGSALGVKASGGIRDRRAVSALVAAGASRIGTSSGVSIMRNDGPEAR